MPKYGVEITDEVSVELDVAPGAPALRRAVLEWEVPESELSEMLERFGGLEAFAQTARGVWVRLRVPLTRDGEQVGTAVLRLWALDEREHQPVPQVFACSRGSR